MPLDMTTQDNFIAEVPENLSFKTVFEPTLFKEKKYVINGETGEYIGVAVSYTHLTLPTILLV